jgi:hypothetical protein
LSVRTVRATFDDEFDGLTSVELLEDTFLVAIVPTATD